MLILLAVPGKRRGHYRAYSTPIPPDIADVLQWLGNHL